MAVHGGVPRRPIRKGPRKQRQFAAVRLYTLSDSGPWENCSREAAGVRQTKPHKLILCRLGLQYYMGSANLHPRLQRLQLITMAIRMAWIAALALTLPAILAAQHAPNRGLGVAASPTAAEVPPTFCKQVAPILFRHCAKCHQPGRIASTVSFLSYDSARPWARAIREKVLLREMPPWPADPHASVRFRNDARLSDEDIHTLAAWVDSGAPKGDESDLPGAPQSAEGWLHPKGAPPDAPSLHRANAAEANQKDHAPRPERQHAHRHEHRLLSHGANSTRSPFLARPAGGRCRRACPR